MRIRAATVLAYSTLLIAGAPTQAQQPNTSEPQKAAAPQRKDADETPEQAVSQLVEQIKQHPVTPAPRAERLALYLIDVDNGDVTLIADEPDPGIGQCGSPEWSHNGKRIIYDASPWKQFTFTHLKVIELIHGAVELTDLGNGNGPTFSPSDDRIAFINNTREGGAPIGVWLMQADGSRRRELSSTYGVPKWSPESRQLSIVDFNTPRTVTLMDIDPEKSGTLQIAGQNIYSLPSWAGEGLIVAVLGTEAADAIALVDVREPANANIREVLWKKGKGLDVMPSFPLYSAASRRGFFAGTEAGKGMALYAFRHGQPGPPRRLEPAGHDNFIMDLALSPDGRYLLFSSDRPGLIPRSAAPGGKVPASSTKSSGGARKTP